VCLRCCDDGAGPGMLSLTLHFMYALSESWRKALTGKGHLQTSSSYLLQSPYQEDSLSFCFMLTLHSNFT